MKLENEELIPLEKSASLSDTGWIDYKKSVYLIRTDPRGTGAGYQFNGVLCNGGYIKGFLHASFQTKAKYFDPEFWYKRTSWGDDFPKKLYFIDDPEGEKAMKYMNSFKHGNWEKRINEIANQLGRPAEKILHNIFETAIKKTGINMEFPFDDLDYGKFWWEAKVPVKFGPKLEYDGLITWENCD